MRQPARSASARSADLNKFEVFAAVAELRRRDLENVDSLQVIDLRLAELKIFSQNGEDGIIAELVRRLPVKDQWFIEFGVEDGTECNTRWLAEGLGWSGLYFEPNAKNCAALALRWAGSATVSVVQEAVTPEIVGSLFERHEVPHQFGVLSIDVDGQDYWIWKALPAAYRPAVVVIECNTSYPSGVSRVERQGLPWRPDHSDSFGASLEALSQLGRCRGYSMVHVELAGVNAFFVRDDLLMQHDIKGMTVRSANYDLRGYRHPPLPLLKTVDPATPII
jgi:hypothetical protein